MFYPFKILQDQFKPWLSWLLVDLAQKAPLHQAGRHSEAFFLRYVYFLDGWADSYAALEEAIAQLLQPQAGAQ